MDIEYFMKQGKIHRKNFEIAVPEANREILKKIVQANILPPDAYLAGGTAVAMYYGHRLSEDFDFFTWEQFSKDEILNLLKEFFFRVDINLAISNTIIANLYIDNTTFTKFSIFKLPYKLLQKPILLSDEEELSEFKIRIASLIDLICMKMTAIADRGSSKDFIDLNFLLADTQLKFSYIYNQLILKYGISEKYIYQLKTGLNYFFDAEAGLFISGDQKVLMYDWQKKEYVPLKKKEWEKTKKFFINLVT